jgi:uncharacterized protein YuzE
MMTAAKVRYDANTDVLYLVCDDGEIARSIEVSPGISVQFGEAGSILSIELLRASKVFRENVIASLHAKQAEVL